MFFVFRTTLETAVGDIPMRPAVPGKLKPASSGTKMWSLIFDVKQNFFAFLFYVPTQINLMSMAMKIELEESTY